MFQSTAATVLYIFGIIGSAITLLSSLKDVIDFVQYLKIAVTQWAHIVTNFWSFLFKYVPFALAPSEQLQVSMAILLVFVSVGSRLQYLWAGLGDQDSSVVLSNVFRWNVFLGGALFLMLSLANHAASQTRFYYAIYSFNPVIITGLNNSIYLVAVTIALWHWGAARAFAMAVACLLMSYV